MPSRNTHRGSTDPSADSLRESTGSSKCIRLLSLLGTWGTVGLPVIYAPLFLAGISTTAELGLFLGLFGLHVLVLLPVYFNVGSPRLSNYLNRQE